MVCLHSIMPTTAPVPQVVIAMGQRGQCARTVWTSVGAADHSEAIATASPTSSRRWFPHGSLRAGGRTVCDDGRDGWVVGMTIPLERGMDGQLALDYADRRTLHGSSRDGSRGGQRGYGARSVTVPEEVNHCEISVRVQMVDEVKLLLAPEPSEACKARPFDVVFLVKIHVRIERRRAGSDHYEEQVERKNKKYRTGDEDRRDEKVGRVVSLVTTIGGGHEVTLGVIPMMKSYVVPVKDAAYPVVTEAIME
jgi:hypothetical protein